MRKIIFPLLAFFAIIGTAYGYTVVSGDYLSKIAQNNNISLDEIIKLNPQIANPDLIYPGDEIYIDSAGNILLGSTKPAALQTYNLAGAGISSSDTSLILSSLTIKQTSQKIADGDLSDTFYVTVEPGNNTKQEVIACTTVTQNSNGSATLSGCSRGMSPIYPWTASSTLAFTHAGGSQVIFSDPPQLWAEFTGKSNDETITGTWNFAVTPTSSDTCSETTEFCTKSYIDGIVNQGAATSTESVGGIAELATAAEMAASTDNGATKPLVLQAKYATSSLTDLTGNYVVISESDGNINQTWLDLTETFIFSSSTITNFLADNATTTARLVVGTSQPTTNDQLFVGGNSYLSGNATTTGSMDVGELCFDGAQCETGAGSKYIYSSFIPVTVANTAAATTLYTFSLPGGTLGTNGVLKMTMFISDFDYEGESAGGSGFNILTTFGSSVSFNVGQDNFSDAAVDDWTGVFTSYVTASSSASLQKGFGHIELDRTGENQTNQGLSRMQVDSAGSENTANAVTVTVSADWGAADVESTITFDGIIAEIIR